MNETPDNPTTKALGIDLPTEALKECRRRLLKLKTTTSAEDGGAYREDPSISQLHVETIWSMEKLEQWCYKTKGVDYIGVFERKVRP